MHLHAAASAVDCLPIFQSYEHVAYVSLLVCVGMYSCSLEVGGGCGITYARTGCLTAKTASASTHLVLFISRVAFNATRFCCAATSCCNLVNMLPDAAGLLCVRTHYLNCDTTLGVAVTGPSAEIQAMRGFCCSQGWPQLSESSQLAVVVLQIRHVALTHYMLHVTLYVT